MPAKRARGGQKTRLEVYFSGLMAHVPDSNRPGAFTTLLLDTKPGMHHFRMDAEGVTQKQIPVVVDLPNGRFSIDWSPSAPQGTTTRPSKGTYDQNSNKMTVPESFDWLPTLQGVLGANATIDQRHLSSSLPANSPVKTQILLPPRGTFQTSALVNWIDQNTTNPNNVAVVGWEESGNPVPNIPPSPMSEVMVFWDEYPGSASVTFQGPNAAGGTTAYQWDLDPKSTDNTIRIYIENLMDPTPAGWVARDPRAHHFNVFYDLMKAPPARRPTPVYANLMVQGGTQPAQMYRRHRCPAPGVRILTPTDAPICPQMDS